jgi:hypothetical protein
MHLAGHATAETWVADADADPVLVVTAPPAASLASELVRLLPELRALLGPDRRATVVFDRGGESATTFAAIGAAGFDLLTYRKGPVDRLPDTAFTAHTGTDPDGQVHGYRLAETTVELPLSNRTGGSVALREIHRQAVDGTQIPVLTSRTDLPAAEVCWRLSARWRQENYFKYARAHFALDALDSYADTPDDPTRPVPNPAKAAAKTAVETARASVQDAETMLSEAIDDAAGRARRPGSGATATVDPAAGTALAAARDELTRRHRHQPRHPRPPAPAPGPPGRPAARRGTQAAHPRYRRWPPTTPSPPSPGCCARTTPGPTTKPAPCSGRPSPCPATCTSPRTPCTSGSTLPPPRAAAVPYTPSASSSPRPEPATPTPT